MALIDRKKAKILLIAGAVLVVAAVALSAAAPDWSWTPNMTIVLFIVGGLKLALGLGWYVMNPIQRKP